jgi:hypothetical protein
MAENYTEIKGKRFSCPQRGCHSTNYCRPGRVWLATSGPGTGNRLLFFTVYTYLRTQYYTVYGKLCFSPRESFPPYFLIKLATHTYFPLALLSANKLYQKIRECGGGGINNTSICFLFMYIHKELM